MISSVLYYILLILLTAGSIILFAFYLLDLKKISPSKNGVAESPYCLRYLCSKESPIDVPLENDPQKDTYHKIQYCIANGPTDAFINALTECAERDGPDRKYLRANLTVPPEGEEDVEDPPISRIAYYQSWFEKNFVKEGGFCSISFLNENDNILDNDAPVNNDDLEDTRGKIKLCLNAE